GGELARRAGAGGAARGAGRPRSAPPEERVGRHALCLPLRLDRLDLLDLDGVADEPVGAVAEQHLRGRRSLLEPRRGVDGVTGDEALPCRGVARNDLAGIHTGAVADRNPPTLLELLVECSQA